jgi:hypothetical protein
MFGCCAVPELDHARTLTSPTKSNVSHGFHMRILGILNDGIHGLANDKNTLEE